jgi:hypothetical protein
LTAPYRRLEFTASSGNKCHLKVFPPKGIRLVVDAAWDEECSEADVAECNAWFPQVAQKLIPGRVIAVTLSTVIEDPDEREAVITAVLSEPANPEMN